MLASLLSSGVIKAAGDAIDALVTSDEERGQLKLDFLNNQLEMERENNKLQIAMATVELEREQARRDIIIAEAKSDSWLTANWRPIVILSLAAAAIMHVFGFTNIGDELASQFLDIVMVAVGGYIGSRGVEKGIKTWKKPPQQLDSPPRTSSQIEPASTQGPN